MTGKLTRDAFEFYAGLGAVRSYQAVAERFGVSKRTVTRHARREDWQARLDRIDRTVRKNTDKKVAETLEGMSERHLATLRVIQKKALEALVAMPLGSSMEAVRALDIAIKQERTIRGEPADRTAMSVEDTIRREYERWMPAEVDGGGEHDALPAT